MTFWPVFGRHKKRHTNLWLFDQFSDDIKNDIQTYDFFPSFRTAKKTTYKPMTFFPVFGRQKKRHTNLWLFSQFSDGKKNDIQTYDFFPSFPTAKKNDIQTYDFFPSFWTAKKTTYKPMTFFPVFGRQKKIFSDLWSTLDGVDRNAWLVCVVQRRVICYPSRDEQNARSRFSQSLFAPPPGPAQCRY